MGDFTLSGKLEALERSLKSAQELLHQTEERFRMLTDAANEAIYEWDLRADVLTWSAGMLTLFGHQAEEMNKGIRWWTEALHPDDRDRIVQSLERAVSAKEERWTGEYRFRKADDGYAYVLDRGQFLYDRESGRAVSMFGAMLDITQQKKAEFERTVLYHQALDSEKRLSDIVGSVPGVVWEAWGEPDSSLQRTNYVSCYVERLLGYSVQEWLSVPNFWLTIVHPEDRERAACEGRAIFLSGRRGVSAFRWITKSGDALWVEAHAIGIHDERGVPVGMRGVTMDVSERVRAEEERDALLVRVQDALGEAHQAVQMRDDFLAMASHELKTPLTSLQLQSQTLLRFCREGLFARFPREKLESMLVTGDQQVARLTELVKDLLDVSRISSGRLGLRVSRFDLADLVREVAARFRTEAERSGSSLEVKTAPGVVGTWDYNRMDQVVTNLITNAMKYGKGKAIEVSLREAGTEILLQVRDQGIGIAPEDQKRIFDRFERAKSARNYGGLGLGLYISREIIHMHGGSIAVESRLGGGSVFTVRLPSQAQALRIA